MILTSVLQFTMFICCTVVITMIQYCNFCQLSFWMRSSLATLVGLLLLAVLWSPSFRLDLQKLSFYYLSLKRLNEFNCVSVG